MAQVVLEKVVKRYGDARVVHGIDLDIKDQEFVVFVGPSGCAKSTTLRMVAGLEEISEGTISIDGRVVNDVQPKDRNVAMVFQDYALYPHMSVYDNMAFSLKMRKHPEEEIHRRVMEASEILGLDDLLKRKPAALSGGQRQRVAMGRAIVRKAEVFLFDEPLSNLDAKLRTQMRTEIKKLHLKLKTTTIYVTHDQVEAMTLADRIVILKFGRIMQVGSPVDVYERPDNLFVATFIGSPTMNILNAEVIAVGDGIAFKCGDLVIPDSGKWKALVKPGDTVKVGVRPEDILLNPREGKLPEEWLFDGTTIVSEIMGDTTLLEADVDGKLITAALEGRTAPAADEPIRLGFNLENMHVFDAKTEQSIR